jgi:hypothetical protein
MALSNRDIATLAWLAVVAAIALSRRGGREAIRLILGTAATFLVPIAVYWAYLAAVVVVAWHFGLWNQDLAKDAVVWAFVPGLALFFGFVRASKERGFYLRAVGRVIGLSAIAEFYVALAAFPLYIELLLVPIAVSLSVMSAFAAQKPEFAILKRVADPLLGAIGLTILVSTGIYVATNWDILDKTELALQFGLPVWLTLPSLPFVFAFSLFANYQGQFVRIDAHTRDDSKARRRAKVALLIGYGVHNHELAGFAGIAYTDLAEAKTWREARRVVAYRRAEARVAEATKDLAAARLVRYAGIAGTDWEGRPYDEREFEETKIALELLAGVHRNRYKNGRYRRDLMALVKGIVSRTLPDDEFVMAVAEDRRSWFAWRLTIGGWYLGIGAVGPPTEDWVFLRDHAPEGFPSAATGWHEGEFPTSIDSDWDKK